MKKDFHQMCSHSSANFGAMLQAMNLSYLRREVFTANAQFAPRSRQSELNMGMDLGLKASKRPKKDHDASIPLHDAALKAARSGTEAPPHEQPPA